MVTPGIVKQAKRSCRAFRCPWPLALGLLAAWLPEVARADDWLSLSRLPPVPQVAMRPQTVTMPNMSGAAVSQGVSAADPADERFYGAERIPRPQRGILNGYDPVSVLERDDQHFQLTSLQEPSAGSSENSKDTAASSDSKDAKADEKKDPQEPPTYGRKPESNALQFLRQQDVLLAPGAWQADTGLIYALFDNDFPLPIFDPITSQVTDVVEAQVRRRLLYSPLATRYGLTKNVQMFATLPVGYSNTQISTFGISQADNNFGIGDLTAGASIHAIKGEDQLPDVITTFDFTAPTGDFNAPVFGLVPGSNLGQGFWAMSASLLFINRYDPVIAFYGFGYRHLFERDFEGILFAPGEQISYQFGIGFSVNDRVTLSTAFQGFYITDTRINGQSAPGTNLEPMTLRFAATIARNCRIIEPFVAIGLTESAPAANFGMVVTFY